GAAALMGQALLDAATRRLLGFELLTAPFVIAQLQMFLILSELGAKPTATHRPAVFLTNALIGWDGPEQMKDRSRSRSRARTRSSPRRRHRPDTYRRWLSTAHRPR